MLNEFKVGFFAIASLMAIAYMTFNITSKQSGFGDFYSYKTIVKDASGIFPKTPIKVAGITAGRIKSIELLDDNALITFTINKKTHLTKGSKVGIRSLGLLGDKYIEIILNKNANEIIKNNGFVTAQENSGMRRMVKDAGEVLSTVKDIVYSLRDTLIPTNKVNPLKEIGSNLQVTSHQLLQLVQSLNTLVSDNSGNITQTIANIKQISKNLKSEFNSTNQGSSLSELKKTMMNINSTTSDLKQLIAGIRNGKGTLGQLLVKDNIADKINTTLSSVNQLVGKTNKLHTEFSAFSGANQSIGAKTEMFLDLYPSPERYYLLGVTISDFGKNNIKRSVVRDQNGKQLSDTTTTNRVAGGILINAQFARKIHNWTFRIGLMESSGGMGIDYYFNLLSNKLTLDLYNYRQQTGINLRLGDEFQIWNVLYGKIFFEDVLYKPSATISAGFKFSDEDLKSVLGLFL